MKFLLLLFVLVPTLVLAQDFQETATVIESIPQYRTIQTQIPVTNCRTVEIPVYGETHKSNLNRLLGATAGGVLGHQIGKGNGKKIATGIGALTGLLAVDEYSNKNAIKYYKQEEVCNTTYRYETHQQLTGYVTKFNKFGRVGSKFTNRSYNAGEQININVSFN